MLTRFTVRVTVLAGFAILAAASLGLLLIGTGTPLWLIAVILACRAVSIGLVITPLLVVLTEPLASTQMSDASTLFNVWQRVAGSFGISVIASLFAAHALSNGPVTALHLTGVVITAVAAIGALGALALPAVRNVSILRG